MTCLVLFIFLLKYYTDAVRVKESHLESQVS